jgi:predicted transcriptional regulator
MAIKKDVLNKILNAHPTRSYSKGSSTFLFSEIENDGPIGNQLVVDIKNHKLETNLRQTRDKLESQPRTNLRQTRDKLESQPRTNLRQTRDKLETDLRQTRDKLESQPRTQLETKSGIENLRQTGDKLKTSKLLVKLSGLQKNILIFVYEECQSVLDSETAPLTIEYVASVCNSPISSIRKTIQRMIKKGFLIRSDHKDGRGGWTKYQLPENIYQEINHLKSTNKLETNLRQTRDKLESQPRTQLETNVPSSSSNIYIKTTTTDLPKDWLEIDLIEYSANFGFGIDSLTKVHALGKFTPNQVKMSLDHFNFDIMNQHLDNVRNPLAWLIKAFEEGSGHFSKKYMDKIRKEREEAEKQFNEFEEENRKLEQAKYQIWLSKQDPKELENQITDIYPLEEWKKKGINSHIAKNWIKSNIYEKNHR